MEKALIPHKESIVTPKEQEEFYLRFEVKEVLCVVRNPWGHLLHLVLSLCSLGLFALAFIWNKKLWKNMRFKLAKIEKATHIILVTEHDEEILLPKKVEFDENGNLRIIIVYRYQKYIYEHGEFIAQRNALKLTHKEVLALSEGISQENYDLLRAAFGDNSIEIKVDSVFKVFTEEALSSFNVYQLFACVIWYFREYMQYAVIILVFVCISIIYEVSLIRGEQRKINQMSDSTLARVYRKARDGSVHSSVVDSRELVPGDVIEISAEEKIPCDLVLIDGSCLIDESLLTGESVPVLKNKLPKTEDQFSDTSKEHILFAGTYCITSRASKDVTQPAKALVYQIGFATTKGRLVRSIMFNDPGVYRFERDSNFFTLGLFLISLVFVGIYYYIAFTKYTDPIETSEVILRSVDIVLTMVPPGLSLSLSIGVEYAQSRLNKQGIVALKGRLINAAGRMKAIFFDKTGTLTINEMKLDSVYLNVSDSSKSPQETPELLDFDEYKRQVKAGERQPSNTAVTQLLKHFAANQGLAYVRNEILGDPMEVELFQFSGACIADEDDKVIADEQEQEEEQQVGRLSVASNANSHSSQLLKPRRRGSSFELQEKTSSKSRKISFAEKNQPNSAMSDAKGLKRIRFDYQMVETYQTQAPELRQVSAAQATLAMGSSPIIPQPSEEKKKTRALDDLYIIQMLDFKSALQRMSVVVKDSRTNSVAVFTKGAPEKVIPLCVKTSLPEELQTSLKTFTKHGYRVLAFGTKVISDVLAEGQSRDFYERDLTFQGLALFKNNLKEQTKPTIKNLKRAQFEVGMITGDNINTAISIAKNCRLIDLGSEEVRIFEYSSTEGLKELAIESTEGDESFESENSEDKNKMVAETRVPLVTNTKKRVVGAIESEHFQRIVIALGLEDDAKEIDLRNPVIRQLATKCRVFARMNPDQKALIVKIMKAHFRQEEYTVGFCGDGANDCIALKEADIGISLSKTEASLSAPFISSIEDISCVERISCEGKGALTTNFDSFRFFCLYSMIQSIGLIVLFAKRTEYSDPVYISADILVALNLANCIGLLRPIKNLTSRLPQYTLFYRENVLSILINCLVAFGVVMLGMWLIQQDPDYQSPDELKKDSLDDASIATYETTFAGLFAIQVTFGVAITFNLKGFFKQRFFEQLYMSLSVLFYQAFVLLMLFGGALAGDDKDSFLFRWYHKLIDYFAFVDFSDDVRLLVAAVVVGSTLLSMVIEASLIWACNRIATPRGKVIK